LCRSLFFFHFQSFGWWLRARLDESKSGATKNGDDPFRGAPPNFGGTAMLVSET
jgi:hypothetical protein